jgi:wyosine [tRNA(Phe)-imidazoG37] synthetase (radical SAM superfamily)
MSRLEFFENAKVIHHPKWLRRWRQDPFSVMPIYLELSPVGMCNHRCTFCAPEFLGYPNRSLSVWVMRKLLYELKELQEEDPDGLGVKVIQFAGEGEPTLHKDLAEIFRLTRKAGIDIRMLTNGTGLTKNLAEKIIPLVNIHIQVSLNAGTEESYQKIHRAQKGHWGLVWKNIEQAVKIRNHLGASKCDIGINMTVLTKESVEQDGTVIPANWPEIE